MSLMREFKEFAVNGNAVDMAVGIVVGAAFGKIVTSLVNDLVMPAAGLLLSGADFSKLQFVLKEARIDPVNNAVLEPAVAIRYGAFVNTAMDFIIIAFSIFLMVKLMNAARRLSPIRAAGANPAGPATARPEDKAR